MKGRKRKRQEIKRQKIRKIPIISEDYSNLNWRRFIKKSRKLARRIKMKQEKANALKKAKIQLASAQAKLREMKEYEESYPKMLRKVCYATKQIQKQEEYRKIRKRKSKNK